jgi:hypothetical protein
MALVWPRAICGHDVGETHIPSPRFRPKLHGGAEAIRTLLPAIRKPTSELEEA